MDLRGGSYQDVLLYLREWPLGRARPTNGNGTWNHVRMECRGSRFRVLRQRRRCWSTRGCARPGDNGRIALPAYTGGVGECTVYYDNVVVTPLP